MKIIEKRINHSKSSEISPDIQIDSNEPLNYLDHSNNSKEFMKTFINESKFKKFVKNYFSIYKLLTLFYAISKMMIFY